MTEWPQMDKGRPASWNQPPGTPAPPQPRPGDPSIVDASRLATPVATPATPPVEPAQPRRCLECDGEVDADGYCLNCGAKAPTEREHFELAPSDWVGAVCDKGLRHARNEDALAVACDEPAGSRAALVVCDGVTTSDASDVASLAAAQAACDLLGEAHPERLGTPASRTAATVASLTRAAAVANDAVAASTANGATNPAACTFAAAYVLDDHIYSGNVGDSRVYVFPDGGEGVQLSTDDSLAAEGIAAGVPRKAAEEAADAHTITRWLGVDGVDVIPHVAVYGVTGPTWLLVCSDGLWNYASDAADLGAVLQHALAAASTDGVAPEPVAVARHLVRWANAQGGHDNISACLARLGVPEEAPAAAQDGADAEIPTAKIRPDAGAPAATVSTVDAAQHAPDPERAAEIDDEPTVEMDPIPAPPGAFEPPQLSDPDATGSPAKDTDPSEAAPVAHPAPAAQAAPGASELDDYDPITHEHVSSSDDVRKDGPHGDV